MKTILFALHCGPYNAAFQITCFGKAANGLASAVSGGRKVLLADLQRHRKAARTVEAHRFLTVSIGQLARNMTDSRDQGSSENRRAANAARRMTKERAESVLKVYSNHNSVPIAFKSFTFAGGEKHIKLIEQVMSQELEIHAHLTTSDAIFELILMVDALRRMNQAGQHLSLFCPYLPYARQDRVMVPGEPLSVRVMCDLINSLKFDRVTVADIHSDVSMALLNRVVNIHVKDLLRNSGIPMNSCIPVAPDAGALKKVGSVAKELELPMVRADKIRDVTDGSIKETVVYFNEITDKDFLIVDDICDGGRTFIELAKKLRPLTTGKIFLYVTHGIFSQGLEPFKGLIDRIFVAYPFPCVDLSDPLITQIHNQDFMKG